MNQDAVAYVLGMTCNGLSVVRSLGRRGVRVIAVDSYKERAGLHSRYCEVLFGPSNIIDDENPWLDFLINISKHQETKPVLFPTEDAYVLFIAKNREILSRYYRFNVPPNDIVDAAVSKLGTYELAIQCNIPTPWTYLIKTMEDYGEIANKINFPCALKPSYAHVWLKRYTPEKLLVINNSDELVGRLKELAELEIEVVLQEIIPGSDDQVYVFAVYVNNDKEVMDYAILHKIRQQPVDFGVGSFDISVEEPFLAETALTMIKKSGYSGMASTEYKFDNRDGKYKLIDINPRTCMIGELAIATGVDLPYIYYTDMVGKEILSSPDKIHGVKWFCFEWDFITFLEYRRRGKLSLFGWISSLKGKKVYAYYAKDDPKPFFYACLQFTKRITRFLRKRIL